MIRLKNEKQIIRVQIWSGGAWRKNITGQVIGSYEGIVGVLLNSGEYIDVPEKHIRILKKNMKNLKWPAWYSQVLFFSTRGTQRI